jgi:hypothetical protein
MASSRIAVLLSTLDERIRPPLARWLRVRHGADHVHRFTVSGAEWKLLAGFPLAGSVVGRRLLRCAEALSPQVMAVLGYPQARGTSGGAARADVRRIVREIEAFEFPADVRGFWMTEEWSTGYLHPEVERTRAEAIADAGIRPTGP